ncbi:probable insulin-like peptide 6 [Drosophila novamexicana]|uniref:probable insulin-like peptide 6 n=1 Tax=Drosophila novamexicana TaxID=47314 RepID=UPI0011E59FD8|nr:probable insulin-like peptide 6 [Drosophila novamexicana]
MICSLPSSTFLPLLAAVVCLAFGLSLVAGTPIAFTPEDLEIKHRCSKDLAETINFICQGRTVSLGQLYPQSFGKRSKRFAADDTFYRPLQNGPIHECCLRACGYPEIRQYCAPD